MINQFVILFFVLMVQEPISSGIFIHKAIDNGYGFFVIFIIFILATILDILIGYSLGKVIRSRGKGAAIYTFLHKKVTKYNIKSNSLNIFSYGVFVVPFFPYSTLLSGLLDIGLKKSLILHLFGEITLWFSFVYSAVMGVKYLNNNLLYIIIFIVLLLIVMKFIYSKFKYTTNNNDQKF